MRKYINIQLLLISLSLFSCENFLEPIPVDERYTTDQLYSNPTFTEGLLMKAYSALPNDYTFESDIASDDAVTNLIASPITLMATGGWKASNDPISQWRSAYEQIYYINLFLENYESVRWASDVRLTDEEIERKHTLHLKRLKGEAHGLRAWYQYQLLQHHSGVSNDGRLLGFVIIDKPLKVSDNWELPRNTFAECVRAIFNDLDTAIANLPANYAASSDPIINETSGMRFENRINGNAAKALKSRVALLAASPAFASSDVISWEEAALISGDFLVEYGALYNNGIIFYNEIRNKEIIWNQSQQQINTWEQSNFPPSMFGNGRTNPSQNLVDAFPMRSGYPPGHPSSEFIQDDPYLNRDSRFGHYIIFNGATIKNQKVFTYNGAPLDGINTLATSTRTGYYLKKFISDRVNLVPGNTTTSAHNYTLIRATEVVLNYAEAANEAWGPDGDPNAYGFTARSKIAQLRARAGITQPDIYLNSITGTEGLRELIRNERRIELCFEGFRFWDLRRWEQISAMNAPVIGASITQEISGEEVSFIYNYIQVEERNYNSDMIYGPLPYEETRKYNLEQNKGW